MKDWTTLENRMLTGNAGIDTREPDPDEAYEREIADEVSQKLREIGLLPALLRRQAGDRP